MPNAKCAVVSLRNLFFYCACGAAYFFDDRLKNRLVEIRLKTKVQVGYKYIRMRLTGIKALGSRSRM